MKKKLAAAAIAMVLMIIVALPRTQASAATPFASEVFYRCNTGYTFEVAGDAAHCKKPARVEQHALAGCPIGLYPTVDKIGDKDMCAGTNPISGEIDVEQGCTSTDVVLGYVKKIVDGKDYCARTHPAEINAPSIAITLTL